MAEAIRIARRSRGIAVQSVLVGMGLSFGAMLFGAFGLLVPVAGAIVQEAIDVAVILNALRALTPDKASRQSRGPGSNVGDRFLAEHKEFVPWLQRIRTTADRLETFTSAQAREELEQVRWFLQVRLLQHEEEEEAAVYPVVAKLLGGEDPMSTMERAHMEIEHLSRVFGHLLTDLPPEGPGIEDLVDLRRVLYGLHAILRLHFAQEEEAYSWLADEHQLDEVAVG
jgi:hemerythrin superfamily protein